MRTMMIALCGVVCSGLWLGLLVVTHFSAIPVGVGLLAAVSISGSSHASIQHSVRASRR